jgi:hypothetical protein
MVGRDIGIGDGGGHGRVAEPASGAARGADRL